MPEASKHQFTLPEKAKTISTFASNRLIFCGKPVANSLISAFYKLTFYVTPRLASSDTEVEIIAREGEIFATIVEIANPQSN